MLTYKTLKETLGSEEYKIYNFIRSIDNKEIRERLIDEAREYYANIFSVPKNEIFYGIITSKTIENPFPYSIVIGNVSTGYLDVDMSKLVYVAGSLKSRVVESFPNLKIVQCTAKFGAKLRSLPKLRKCPYLYICNTNIEELPSLIKCETINASGSKLKKLAIKNLSGNLYISNSDIEDISSLEYVEGSIVCENTSIKKVNPNLKIGDSLYCFNSDNFEEKVKAENIVNDCVTTSCSIGY